jgi:hypothetical protein
VSTSTNFTNKIVGHEMVPPDQLLANPLNFRVHSHVQKDHMRAMLREIGWLDEIIVNRNSGVVVNGHMRVDIALTDNEPLVPVRYVDLTEEEENLALATYDNVAALAGTDRDQLESLLSVTFTDDDGLADFLRSLQPSESQQYETPVQPDNEDYSDQDTGGEKWLIIVTCTSEGHQRDLLEEFEAMDIECRPLSS